MEQKMEVIISGSGNCMCKGPGAGQTMTSKGSRKEASVAGKVRWVWTWGDEAEREWWARPEQAQPCRPYSGCSVLILKVMGANEEF